MDLLTPCSPCGGAANLKGYALCRRPLLTSSGLPFWHLESTLGGHFGVSRAPWEAILAPRDHPGGPWEQQDGHEVANNRIFVDVGLISRPVYVSFWASKCVLELCFFQTCFQVICLSISDSSFRRLGLPHRRSRMEGIANIDFSWKSFSKNFGIDL